MGGGGGSISRDSDYYSKGISKKKVDLEDDCNSVNITIDLVKLQPALSSYALDDVLSVEIDSNANIIATGSHGICGYITSLDSNRLIACLNKGIAFKAVIILINATSCRVRITIKI